MLCSLRSLVSAGATRKQCVTQTRGSGLSASTRCGLAFAAWGPGSLGLRASAPPGPARLGGDLGGRRVLFVSRLPGLPRNWSSARLSSLSSTPAIPPWRASKPELPRSRAFSNSRAGARHREEVRRARRSVRTVLEKRRQAEVWSAFQPDCHRDAARTFGVFLGVIYPSACDASPPPRLHCGDSDLWDAGGDW